jgi:predicted nucleic acid-binding protein
VTDFLLDTNVISELARPRPSPYVLSFINGTALDSLFLSEVVVAELRFGIEKAVDARRRGRLQAWLDTAIRPMFHGRIIPVSEDIFLRWRYLVEGGRRSGRTFPQPDLFIAATADYYGMTVVTRDTSPFERAGVSVINPWREIP